MSVDQRTDLGEPRLFYLQRDEDESGVSGTGRVADGVVWPDGAVVVRWRTTHATTEVADSLDDYMLIHGHGGRTKVVWHDIGTIQAPTKRCGSDRLHNGHPWVNQRGTSVYEYWCLGR